MIFKIITPIGLVLLVAVSVAFAQEEILLNTYYPAPYGEYDELRANTHNADTINVGFSTSTSTRSGIVNFKAVSVSPTTGGTAGDLCFNGTEFKYCDTTGGGYKGFNRLTMSNITTYQNRTVIGDVTLVDLSGKSGVFLGGSVTGWKFDNVRITADGTTYTIPANIVQVNGSQTCHLTFPGPIKFNDSLKIEYTDTVEGDSLTVSGTAYVVESS